MTPAQVQLFVHYIIVCVLVGKSGEATRGNLRGYRSKWNRGYETSRQPLTELPVTFEAPDLESRNFWNRAPSDETTFPDEFRRLTTLNANARILSSPFDFANPPFDPGVHSPAPIQQTPSQPYPFENPYQYYFSTEKNVLPPPKPVRASIIKLETITRSPDPTPPSFDSTYRENIAPFRNYTNFGKESFHIDELGFHTDSEVNFQSGPFVDVHYENRTTTYPSIPEKNGIGQITVKPAPKKVSDYEGAITNETSLDVPFVSPPNVILEIDQTTDRQIPVSTEAEYPPSTVESPETTTASDVDAVTLYENQSSTEIAVTEMKNENQGFEDKDMEEENSTTGPVSNSVNIITDLTVEGLAKNKKQTANIANYAKSLNMSTLIDFELDKLKSKATSEDKPNQSGSQEVPREKPDPKDEDLSLDLKILRDTNWDGFADSPEIATTTERETTTEQIVIESAIDQPNTVEKNQKSHDLESQLDSKGTANGNKNNDKSKNGTVIIETRITKSITKSIRPSRKFVPKNPRFKDREHSENILPPNVVKIPSIRGKDTVHNDVKHPMNNAGRKKNIFEEESIDNMHINATNHGKKFLLKERRLSLNSMPISPRNLKVSLESDYVANKKNSRKTKSRGTRRRYRTKSKSKNKSMNVTDGETFVGHLGNHSNRYDEKDGISPFHATQSRNDSEKTDGNDKSYISTKELRVQGTENTKIPIEYGGNEEGRKPKKSKRRRKPKTQRKNKVISDST